MLGSIASTFDWGNGSLSSMAILVGGAKSKRRARAEKPGGDWGGSFARAFLGLCRSVVLPTKPLCYAGLGTGLIPDKCTAPRPSLSFFLAPKQC